MPRAAFQLLCRRPFRCPQPSRQFEPNSCSEKAAHARTYRSSDISRLQLAGIGFLLCFFLGNGGYLFEVEFYDCRSRSNQSETLAASIGGAVTGQNLVAPLNDFSPIFECQRVFIDVARGAGRKEICYRSEGMFARSFVHVPPITEAAATSRSARFNGF